MTFKTSEEILAGLGKRSAPGQYSFGLGKRGNQYSFGLGK